MESSGSGLAGVLIGALLVGVAIIGVLYFTGTFGHGGGGGGGSTVKIELPKPTK